MAQSVMSRPQVSKQTVPPKKQWRPIWPILSLPLLLFISLPIVALLQRTPPTGLWHSLSEPAMAQAIRLSLITTFISTGLAVLLGTPLAYLLAHERIPLRHLIDTIIDLPLVLPPAVAGVALLMTFGRRGILGVYLDALGIDIAFTQVAVVLAQLFVSAPFYVKAATIGFSGVSQELKEAAALDGASSWAVFRHITWPLAWGALLSGMVMTWARALGEFGATIIFAGNYSGRTQTMPLAIYIGFELDMTVALTLSAILVACSFLVLLIVKGVFKQDVI